MRLGRLDGKVALMTGAGSGIGRATAVRFAEEGALRRVRRSARRRGAATAGAIGGDALGIELDVTSSPSIRAGVAQTVEKFGGLDVLVCNAGVTIVGSVMDLSEDEWDTELATNLKSVFLCAKAAWEHLVARGGGSILATASMAGQWAIPGDAAYCASKAGVIMLTKCMALDGAKQNVRANCVCPGYTQTPMIEGYFEAQPDPAERSLRGRNAPPGPPGPPARPRERVRLPGLGRSAWVTGTALVVDGGITAESGAAEARSGGCTFGVRPQAVLARHGGARRHHGGV